jgi:hypothetical protein
MISIRRYLNAEAKNQSSDPEPGLPITGDLCAFARAVLDQINQFVLTADAGESLRSQLLQVRDSLRPNLKPDEAARAAASVSSTLAAHHASSKRAAGEQIIEAQHVFSMLNEALVVLADGNDRAISRLGTIQESLQRTTTMRDMSALRASLADTVEFIKVESVQARESAAQEMQRFDRAVNSAREILGSTRLEFAGRPEGVSRISDSMKNLALGEAVYLVAYLCDRLHAVTQRYGPGVADELMSRLVKERVRPVMPGNTMYRWTPRSLVAVFSRPRDPEKVRNEVASLNRTPLVHRIALGGRTAVLTLSPSHLVVEGVSGPASFLVDQVDKFTLAVA